MKSKLITIVLILITIFAPLLIIPETETYDYNILKFLFLMIAGAVLLILLLINYKKIKIDIKDTLIFIFLGLIILSTFFSSDIKKSILGEVGRYEGVLMFSTYICIYIASKKFFYCDKIKDFLNIIFYTGLIIGILGILQRHIDCKQLYPIFNRLIASTFGNSNFFGSYISIILPGAMYIYILYNSKRAFLLSIIMFFNMIASGTRSAWVAFTLIALIGIVYLINQKDKKYFKRAIILIIIFILIFGYLYSNINIFNNKNSKMTKFTEKKFNELVEDIEEFKSNGITKGMGTNRVIIWTMTLELISKQPLLGCGPDNLKYGLKENSAITLLEYVKKVNRFPDKAHNEYLNIAATIGIPALIVYLVFLGLIVSPKIKIIFKDKIFFIIILIVLSYLTQAFFNISTIGVAPLFWMILGLCDNERFIAKIKEDMNEQLIK